MVYSRKLTCGLVALMAGAFVLAWAVPLRAGPGDLNIDGTFEGALDLPRIYFLLRREPTGPPLTIEGEFAVNFAFLDTGASGGLLSLETKDYMGIALEPGARFVDVGVAGNEDFNVSEPLYLGYLDFSAPDPCQPELYELLGPWRFQIKQTPANWLVGPIDILGIPLMAGKTAVLNTGITNESDIALFIIEYFAATVTEPNDPCIPDVDFKVPLRFEKYITPNDPCNIPPLPILAYNPVIDNITVENNTLSSTGTWLLDTGASASMISTEQGFQLGLVDALGDPVVTPDFYLSLSGVGGSIVYVPGFIVDNLVIPTLAGYNLIFNNARLGVHDIAIFKEDIGEFEILDGIFGSNFLCASMDTSTLDLRETPFDWVVIDTQNATLGFDLNDVYPLPTCGDAEHPPPTYDVFIDCYVDILDLAVIAVQWLRQDCSAANNHCDGADLNGDHKVNLFDQARLRKDWGDSPFRSQCGDPRHPWPTCDFNRDCSVDLLDLFVLNLEWLNDCDWLNWNCRGADMDPDGTTSLTDFARLNQAW